MRGFGMAVAAAAIGFAVPAQAQFSDVADGKRHDKTGLTCPVKAGAFELKDASGDDTKFNCRYELRCRAVEGCAKAIGFASLTWNRQMDFAGQFKEIATRQGLKLVQRPGPEWAGPTKMFAEGGEGENLSHAGWWFIQSRDEPLHLAILWNVGADASAKALAKGALAMNP